MYSWYTTSASSPPFAEATSGSPNRLSLRNRYICIVGAVPSGGVVMFALSTCPRSGKPPPAVFAPSEAFPRTGSWPPVPPYSKLPAASVNEIGAPAR